MNYTIDRNDRDRLQAALDTLRSIKSSATDDIGMFSDDNAIDCCDRGIDAIIDLLDSNDSQINKELEQHAVEAEAGAMNG